MFCLGVPPQGMAGDRCISIGTIQKYLANPEKKFQNRHLLDKLKTLPNREINFKFGLIHRSTNNSLPSMWNFKETRTEKCVAQFVRWEICLWTLLWERISLRYYCSVFRKRSDEGPSILRLNNSGTSFSEWTSFLLLNPYSRNLHFRVLKFIEIPWYFSRNWTIHQRQNSSLLTNSLSTVKSIWLVTLSRWSAT